MAMAAASMDEATWESAFSEQVQQLRSDVGYEDSVEQLRGLLRSGLLRLTDIQERPERFFKAHRIMGKYTSGSGPGFFIRFTVQYNLFAGTVVAAGTPEQLKLLDEVQEKGLIGCFGLTERFAGVNSGLVVQTTAHWDPERQQFCLHSPSEGAYKNWISQGLMADLAVVMATLYVDGKSVGPQAFLMEFRRDGRLVDGVTIGDMGQKTTGNDLDNAWICFDRVMLPADALLSAFGRVEGNRFVKVDKDVRPFDMIGQRLYSGRVAIAQTALSFGRNLFDSTRQYTDSKKCWSVKGTPPLSDIPQLRSLYREAYSWFDSLDGFCERVEQDLNKCLRERSIPSTALAEAVAVSKVRAVESTIWLCFRLKQEVGSYALMSDSGFLHLDFLQCCKFAEGDSRILMQKMARDRMRAYAKNPRVDEAGGLCSALDAALQAPGYASKDEAWDANWEKTYGLADAIMDRVYKQLAPGAKL